MEQIILSDIIAIIGLFVANITIIFVAWNRTQIKIKEIEVNLQSMETKQTSHELACQNKFNKLDDTINSNQREINNKLDSIIEKFDNFRVYVAEKITQE
jgi:hypothetical protein